MQICNYEKNIAAKIDDDKNVTVTMEFKYLLHRARL